MYTRFSVVVTICNLGVYWYHNRCNGTQIDVNKYDWFLLGVWVWIHAMFRCKHPYIRYLWITDRWMVWIWVDRPFRLLSKGCLNQKSSFSTRSLRNVLLKSRQSIPMAWWTGLLTTSWLSAILWTGTWKQDRQVVQDQIWTWNNWFSLFFLLFFWLFFPLCCRSHWVSDPFLCKQRAENARDTDTVVSSENRWDSISNLDFSDAQLEYWLRAFVWGTGTATGWAFPKFHTICHVARLVVMFGSWEVSIMILCW